VHGPLLFNTVQPQVVTSRLERRKCRAAGHPTDVALQRAKLAYLQRYRLPEEQLPIHWAGWQIYGEGVAVGAPNPWRPWLLAVGCGMGVGEAVSTRAGIFFSAEVTSGLRAVVLSR
jgi:uncharacterized membrane protein